MDASRFAMWLPEFWRICTKDTPGCISPQHKSMVAIIAAIPEKFRHLFIAAEAMVASAHGFTSGYAEIRATGSVPIMRNVLSGECRETIHHTERTAQQHFARLTSESVLAELQRAIVELTRYPKLDKPALRVVGFQLRGTDIETGFTIVTCGDPAKNAGVVLSQCRGYCYERGLWLLEPSDMRKILNDLGTSSASEKPKPPQTFAEIHNNNRAREKAAGKQPAPKKKPKSRR